MITPGSFTAGRAMQAAYGPPRFTVEDVRAQLTAEARANPNMHGAAARLDVMLSRVHAHPPHAVAQGVEVRHG